MVRTLVHLSLSVVCQHNLGDDCVHLPPNIKQRLLEFVTCHGQLALPSCASLVQLPRFGLNLTVIHFYISDDVTDEMLEAMTEYNKNIEQITLIECNQITDKGIQAVTLDQSKLSTIELRAMKKLTGAALSRIRSERLFSVDLSGCYEITSQGIHDLVSWNRNIRKMYINNCKALNDNAFYAIAYYLKESLQVLEMDFLMNLATPAATLAYLAAHCPNLSQLSLARFFHQMDEDEINDVDECKIDSFNLENVDLYENFFVTLPRLPPSVRSIRLSLSGSEDITSLIATLTAPELTSINLQLRTEDASLNSIDNANAILTAILPIVGHKITTLQVAVQRLFDTALMLITENLPNLKHLAFFSEHFNNKLLQKYFAAGNFGCKLRTLKITGMRVSYRVLFAIARGAKYLTELETPHILSVDDRFLGLLADNCRLLRIINVNGCKYVSDKGLTALARRCALREVFIRGTACTDVSIYHLARHCPNMELLSYRDFSGKPNFSPTAMNCLQNSCIQRVLC